MSDEARKLAAEILADEAWYNALDPSMKDELSPPNHDHHQAEKGVRLARLLMASPTVTDPSSDGSQEGS